MNPLDRVHAGIRDLKPYEPGRPIEAVARELGLKRIIKLASNENPLGPSPLALEAARAALIDSHRYPEGAGVALRERLAAATGLGAERILLGNGSNELLELALRTFVQPGQVVVSAAVTFSVYGLLARALGARYVTAPMDGVAYDLDALAATVRREDAAMVFVANPNNPTGTAFDRAALQAFLDAVPPRTLVVYDAAYAEYGAAAGIPDGLDLLDRYDNLIVTRTFSKVYGLAGLRIGWCAASAALVDLMGRVRQPFNTNRIAQAAATAALDDHEFLERTLATNRRSLAAMAAAFSAHGLEWTPSYANFLLVRVPIPADAMFERLLGAGVIVRSMRSFGLNDYIRINSGSDEETEFFAAALDRVMADLAV